MGRALGYLIRTYVIFYVYGLPNTESSFPLTFWQCNSSTFCNIRWFFKFLQYLVVMLFFEKNWNIPLNCHKLLNLVKTHFSKVLPEYENEIFGHPIRSLIPKSIMNSIVYRKNYSFRTRWRWNTKKTSKQPKQWSLIQWFRNSLHLLWWWH